MKHTYNQAFAIYALSSYYDASGDKEALDIAFSIYDVIEAHCKDDKGYLEAFDRNFQPVSNEKLSENGVMAEKTMNTLLHVFEGYTELYRVTKDKRVGENLRWMLDIFAKKVYNPDKKRQEVFFDKDWNTLIDLYSYGHDIETSWLIDRGLEILNYPAVTEKLSPITDTLAEQIYKIAYKDHSVINECERGVDNTTRVWWVQAESVLGFSGGKDSVATLDLCVKHFRHVEGFFMYYVKGLSFQEQICRYYEDRYGLPIHRVPHFELSQFLRYGLYRPTDFSVPVVSVKDVYNYLRLNTDIWWIAAGERIADSVWRRAIIKSSGTIDEKRGRIYPVAEWRKEDVVAYIRQNKLKVGVESRKLGFSFGSLQAREVIPVKRHFPADFARIRAWFPFVEAGIVHHQIKEERRGRETQQVPEV